MSRIFRSLALIIGLMSLPQLSVAQHEGSLSLTVYPPACSDCCNGRIILTDCAPCPVPGLSYTWLLDSLPAEQGDSVLQVCSGYQSLTIADASGPLDTLHFYVRSDTHIYEIHEYYSCFDSTAYRPDIEFIGVMLHADTRDTLDASEVVIYQDGRFFTKLLTPVNDTFSTLLPLNHEYRMEFNRPGYFSKTLLAHTKNVDPWKVGHGYSAEVSVTMIPESPGLALDILSDPIGILNYNTVTNIFEWDWEYTARMKEALDTRLREYKK